MPLLTKSLTLSIFKSLHCMTYDHVVWAGAHPAGGNGYRPY